MLCEFLGLGIASLCWSLQWMQDAEILSWSHMVGN